MNETKELDLSQFYGTEEYHRWSILFPRFVLTDGAKYLAEQAGAYWLMDAIASYKQRYVKEGFAVAHLKKAKKGWVLTIDDGNDNVLAKQKIEYSDFPLDEIKLYAVQSGDLWVMMLPTEY
jgi:hypothetical protein